MTTHKHNWVAVYDMDGGLLRKDCSMPGCIANKSLGRSIEGPVKDEIRAAQLVWDVPKWTEREEDGYTAHLIGGDVPEGGWAGWLEREIMTHEEQEQQTAIEQTRHDVAASVVRHVDLADLSAADAEFVAGVASAPPKPSRGHWPEQPGERERLSPTMRDPDELTDEQLMALAYQGSAGLEPPPGWQVKVHAACDEVDRERALDGIDQSEPTTPTEPVEDTTCVPAIGNTDDEDTHVGAVDKRFDDGGES